MDRSRLGSLLIFVFVVIAFTVAAPSIEQPTRIDGEQPTHGGKIDSSDNSGSVIGPSDLLNPGIHGETENSQKDASKRATRSRANNSNGESDNNLSLLEIVAGIFLLVVIGGTAFVFYRNSGTRIDPDRFVAVSEESSETEDIQPEPDLAAVGTAAGRAAEHIENDDAQNAVYHAWHEMTTLLDLPDPETTTPGEFADEAFDIGMNPDDVARLTEVFEEVRYGDAPVTPDRRQQAREALRRIESRHRNEGNDES